ncbi:hypothetical protein HHI36_005887 [Cryptolaemus montrouzieri]|uniref:Poly [ADP-ribose] polymerase n=1 Tax=Cryptolaemus montrouzieri TaxID=559131 RepID=A0ABD2NVR8_9CUCU
MPLGKLSKTKISSAYEILSELQELLENEDAQENEFIDATNRFYSFIPHSFGVYNLPILKTEELIVVERLGEKQRFKQLYNRMLLWQGSRNNNFAGILSQGLRIAPPEAPSTSYMFGKGIYFADMVSKSAKYCYASQQNNHGLLLLCDVALGNISELNQAKYIKVLPLGIHSVKGLGWIQPNPEQFKKLGNVTVPVGKPVPGLDRGHLIHNEYPLIRIFHLYTQLIRLLLGFIINTSETDSVIPLCPF